jgi:rhodanese-related sulfurtransferase
MAVARITKEDLKARLDGATEATKPVIVDARLKYPFEHSTVTLPGAVRLAPGLLDSLQIPKDRLVVVYDSDPDELVSERVCAELTAQGYQTMVLAGGIADWVNAKLPTDSKHAPQPIAAVSSLKG